MTKPSVAPAFGQNRLRRFSSRVKLSIATYTAVAWRDGARSVNIRIERLTEDPLGLLELPYLTISFIETGPHL